jgi:hypothetical protein
MLPDRSQPLRATAGSRLKLTWAPTRIKGRGRNLLARWRLRWAEAIARAEAGQQVDFGASGNAPQPVGNQSYSG